MTDNLNTVKTSAAKTGGYHHGDLRSALMAAAEEVIRERGVDGFSLREAARRAGVSAAAPQHHFGDARGLLTAIATAGFMGLGDALADAGASDATDAHAALTSLGRAYVRFALAEPTRFDVMWRMTRIDRDDEAYQAASGRAFALLQDAVLIAAGPRPDSGPGAALPDPRAIAAWSLAHGFARLALDGAFGTGPGAAEAAAGVLLQPVLDMLSV
ncbi:MAG: TetR/AcrR family transcriptional regulator [Hansschlegelia sp.]